MSEPQTIHVVVCSECGVQDTYTVKEMAKEREKNHQLAHGCRPKAEVGTFEYSRTHRGVLV